MITLIQKANILTKNYKPGEFLPIYEGGELVNKNAFLKYKARCVFIKRSLI